MKMKPTTPKREETTGTPPVLENQDQALPQALPQDLQNLLDKHKKCVKGEDVQADIELLFLEDIMNPFDLLDAIKYRSKLDMLENEIFDKTNDNKVKAYFGLLKDLKNLERS